MAQKFIESICNKNGSYQNLSLHQLRIDQTFCHFFLGSHPIVLDRILPKIELEGTYKVRVVYDAESEDVEFIDYLKRPIQTLKVVESKTFDYSFKFEDRKKIDHLKASSNADDIIIAFNGEIKDSSYANLVFWNGSEWLTPKNPLLGGVKRAQLLTEGKIKKAPIHVSDLGAFEKVGLINAMLDLGEMEVAIKELI